MAEGRFDPLAASLCSPSLLPGGSPCGDSHSALPSSARLSSVATAARPSLPPALRSPRLSTQQPQPASKTPWPGPCLNPPRRPPSQVELPCHLPSPWGSPSHLCHLASVSAPLDPGGLLSCSGCFRVWGTLSMLFPQPSCLPRLPGKVKLILQA